MIQKPFAISIQGRVLDGNENNNITWRVSGGIQYAFAIVIKNNDTNDIVWTLNKTNSFSNTYILPSNSIPSGSKYKLELTVWDESNNQSTSDQIIFEVSSRPIVILNSLPSKITSSSYLFSATYTQNENVLMRSWIAFLYDSNQNLIRQTSISTESNLQHMFTNFENEGSYYVEFQATSRNGLIGTTGRIPFYVEYSQPTVYVDLQATNHDKASIKLSWNVVQIILKAENHTFPDLEHINVTNGRFWADQGFRIDKNFTIGLWLKNPYEWRRKPEPPIPPETINDLDGLIGYENEISNTGAMWLESNDYDAETDLEVIAHNQAPSNLDVIWIDDINQDTELQMQTKFMNEPTSTDMFMLEGDKGRPYWLEDDRPIKENKYLFLLKGNNVELYLEYYYSRFHFFKKVGSDVTHVATEEVSGENFFIQLQQINGNIGIKVVEI